MDLGCPDILGPNSTFSNTVIYGNNALETSWNMTVRSVPGPLIAVPLISKSPVVGCSNPATIFNSVDFPQPLGPRRVKKAPSAISRSIFFRMQIGSPERLEKLFEIFLNRSFGNVLLYSFKLK